MVAGLYGDDENEGLSDWHPLRGDVTNRLTDSEEAPNRKSVGGSWWKLGGG